MNTRFAAGSLRIKYAAVDGTMLIDPDSARNLELIGNTTHRKSNHSLFGFAMLSCLYALFLYSLCSGYSGYSITLLRPWLPDFYVPTSCPLSLVRINFPPPLLYLTLEVVHSAIDARLDVVEGKFKQPLSLVSYLSSRAHKC